MCNKSIEIYHTRSMIMFALFQPEQELCPDRNKLYYQLMFGTSPVEWCYVKSRREREMERKREEEKRANVAW